jgi:hypothetical protein
MLNQNLYKDFRKKDLNFLLKGIRVFDFDKNEFSEVHLDLYEGVLIGYRIIGTNFDVNRIDVSNLEEASFPVLQEDKKYKRYFEGLDSSMLDVNNGFEVEISGQKYFVIKDLGDGNYISINDIGKVYGMFHDPFLIEEIYDSTAQFINDVNLGMFSIDKYYQSKLK